MVGTAVALAALGYAVSVWSVRDPASLVLLTASGLGFGVVGWLHPMSGALFSTLTASLLLAALAIRNWWFTGIVVAFILLLFWLGIRRHVAGVDPDSVAVTDRDAYMPGAEQWIAEFSALGYRHVASTKARVGNIEVISSLLLSRDRTSFAAVTDAVMAVTSLFGDGRGLETRNSAFVKLPPWILDNPAPGGTPRELVDSHAKACRLIAERGTVPITIREDELGELAVGIDISHIRWVDQHPQRLQDPNKAEPLWHRLGRYQEIASWQDLEMERP